MAWAVAISVALHALAALPMARWTADEALPQAQDAAQPAMMEVLLSDPTRGAAPEDDQPSDPSQTETAQAAEDAETPPPETSATESPAHEAPPTDTAAATPVPAEPPPEAAEDALPLPPPPPPMPQPTPSAAPRRAAAAPVRLRPGASPEGRDEGRTEIVVGDNVVPASADPGRVNIPPRYPLEAARRGQQGEVVLSLLVATDGSVISAEVARSSGFPALDRAAREAAAKWHFRPGTRDGIPVPTTVPYTMVFQLGG